MTTIRVGSPILLVAVCCLAACGESRESAAALDDETRAELQARIDALGDAIESAEALRAIKRLQWAYGHYSEFGLWHDFADLFADSGIGHYTQGDLDREGIRALFLDQVGQGQLGLAPGRIYPHISFSPVVSLAENGLEAAGRFRILAMLGGYGGNAIWFHGVYQNTYVNERGVWKIDELFNAAQVSGSFAAGLSSQTVGATVIPFYYGSDEVGRPPVARRVLVEDASPVATTATDLQQMGASLAILQWRLDRLEDEAAIVRLQHRYGYYLDRHDWDALVALFAEQGRFEPGLQGVYVGRASIRRALNQFGDAAPAAGEIDDHILFQTYVSVAPDGASARARVDQLGLQGNPGVSAQWTQGIYENTFIKENGEWRIQSLHYYPRLITDYARGWGADAQPAPGPSAAFPPDAPPTEQHGVYPEFHIPAFHFAHPVTGRPPQYPEGDPAASRPVGFAESAQATVVMGDEPGLERLRSRLLASEARAQRSLAYDAVENLIDAYAFYLDECLIQEAAALFIEDVEVSVSGSEAGRGTQVIANTLRSNYCPAGRQDGEIALHHLSQPVITVADNGRTARFVARLWEIHASNEGPDTYGGSLLEGEAHFDDGRWKLAVISTSEVWTAPANTGPI